MFEPNIRNFHGDDFYNKMIILITQTHLKCGFPLDVDQVNLTANELCEDLQKYNGSLSFSEIELAFKNGYKDVYGKFFGLNNKTYFQWVNAYAYGQSRLRVAKMIQDAKEKQNAPPEKTPEEIKQIVEAGILTAFEQFKRGGLIFDAGNVKYRYLVNAKLLNFTLARKLEILNIVKERMKNDAIETKQNNETIAKALSRITPETEISNARTESLKIYFKDLIDTGIEISDLLENNLVPTPSLKEDK